jgi:hypothetical protein
MALPTKPGLHPLENQATITLAWLLDRSPTFCRRFCGLFFEGDESANNALMHTELMRARTWVALPPLAGYTHSMYPDLSVAGSDRRFELLVEVKVAAPLHAYDTPDGPLWQPTAYANSWLRNCKASDEAVLRRVGTLTATGTGLELPAHPFRGKDVTWQAVRETLAELDGQIEPHAVAVALDFISAIDQKLLARPKPQLAHPLLGWGYSLLWDVLPRLEALVLGAKRLGPAVATDYVRGHLNLPSASGDLQLWLFVTPAGGKYAWPGAPPSFWLAERSDKKWPAAIRDRAVGAGFEDRKDNAGWRGFKANLAASVIRDRPENEQADYVLGWVSDRLHTLRVTDHLEH